jgi:hypothetical protein
MLAGGEWVRHGGLIGCSLVGSWAMNVLVMRVGACAAELCLVVEGLGCVMASCVGGSGGYVFRGMSGLLSMFWLCLVGHALGCVVTLMPSRGFG